MARFIAPTYTVVLCIGVITVRLGLHELSHWLNG